jgi:hypothetical protein
MVAVGVIGFLGKRYNHIFLLALAQYDKICPTKRRALPEKCIHVIIVGRGDSK